MNYNKDSAIGVLGGLVPERTSMDIAMQREFNPLNNKEGYQASPVGITQLGEMGFRTEFDMAMQREFNPLLKSQENYCGNTRPGFASTSDIPSNPASFSARFLPPQ